MRKITRSPGRALWLVVFLADKAAQNFNMLVVTVYETSQKMFFLRTKQSVQSFTCNIIRNFARYGRQPYEFRFFPRAIIALVLSQKNSIKFGTWSLAFLGYSFKRVVTSALTVLKRGRRSGEIYFCMNPRIAVYANLIFYDFLPLRLLG